MKRYAICIEFHGAPFMGWQRQNHGPSVQQTIEEAIYGITQQEVVLQGAGRTDAGVHAKAMVAHFDLDTKLSDFRLIEGINAKLIQHPIAILDIAAVADDWHARFSCHGRSYRYRIINRRAPLTHDKGLAWRVARTLDVDAMHDAAQCLIGVHDFTTFRSTQCQSKSPVKSLEKLIVRRKDEHEIWVEAAAISFLHHQVRSIVGCLAEVGMGKWDKSDLQSALEAKDRNALALNAPPDGLYFMGALYEDPPFAVKSEQA